MAAERFEVDTDQLRSAAARLSEMGQRLGHPAPPALGSDEQVASPADGSSGPCAQPAPQVDPGALLGDAGLDGWSCGSMLAQLSADWNAAVSGLAAEYADHAEQLRAAARRYDDAERIIEQALREAGGC